MDAENIITAIATAIGNRVKALEAEAEQLLKAGEADYAKVKAALAAELKALAAEIQQVLQNL
jgi:TfoX/Sxy family transcriptional regulator of competence genes